MSANDSSETTIERRTLIKSIGATSALVGLAGCGGNGGADGGSDGGSGTQLGERVPELSYLFYTTGGLYENTVPPVTQSFENLGFQVNARQDPGDLLGSLYGDDSRTDHWFSYGFWPLPHRIDPATLLRTLRADWAGANGLPNRAQYVNCEYTSEVETIQTTADDEVRRQAANRAQQIMTEDVVSIPLDGYNVGGMIRTDQLDVADEVGPKGIIPFNIELFAEAEGLNGTSAIVNPQDEAFLNDMHPQTDTGGAWMTKATVPNSPLIHWDRNNEFSGLIAELPEISEDGTTYTFKMKDGTFHDGRPITAHDVVWSWGYTNEWSAQFSSFEEVDYESLEAPDDETVVVSFSEPRPGWLRTHAALASIMNSEMMEENGWDGDPTENFQPEGGQYPGAGPWKIDVIDRGNLVTMVPHDGHPTYPEPNLNYEWPLYLDTQTEMNAFLEGSVNFIWSPGQGGLTRAEANLDDDQWRLEYGEPIGNRWLFTQNSFAPGKFKEFREALSMALNRRNVISQAVPGGLDVGEPEFAATMFGSGHPWRAPDDMLYKPTTNIEGEPERAKQLLEEAGWGQDDNGNWHYPPDADLSPVWPEGERPGPDEEHGGFPCLDSEGEYAG